MITMMTLVKMTMMSHALSMDSHVNIVLVLIMMMMMMTKNMMMNMEKMMMAPGPVNRWSIVIKKFC